MRFGAVRRRTRIVFGMLLVLLLAFALSGAAPQQEDAWIDQLTVSHQAGIRLDVTSPHFARAWPGSYLGLGIGTDLHLFGSDLTIDAFPGVVVVDERGTHFFWIETTESELREVRDLNEARGICYVITAYINDNEYLVWNDTIYAKRDAGDNWAIELEWARDAALANLLAFGVSTGYRVYRRFVALNELGCVCQTSYPDLVLIEEFPSDPEELRIIFQDHGHYGDNPEGSPAIGAPGQVFDSPPLGNLGVGMAAPAGGSGNASFAGRVGIGGAPDTAACLNIVDHLGADIRLDATLASTSTSLAGQVWTIRSSTAGSFTVTDNAPPGTFCAGGNPRLEINAAGKVGLGVSPVGGPAGSLEVAHSLGVGMVSPPDCGDVSIAGTLNANAAAITVDLTVDGVIDTWDLFVMNDVDILNNLFVAGNADVLDLNVETDINVGRDLMVGRDLHVNGVKFFVQEHPTDPTQEIAYAALEGPEAGTYVRGTASLTDGEAVIELPESFHLVTAEEGLTVQVTLLEPCNGLYVAGKSTERIVVRELLDGTSNAKFDYLVQGVRVGYEDYYPIRTVPEEG